MKRFRILILAGLLTGAAPTVSFAACSPACTGTDVCRITAQGPPTVYTCMAPPAKKKFVAQAAFRLEAVASFRTAVPPPGRWRE